MTEEKRPPPTKAKFYEPPNTLKKKVGDGGISEISLKRAQEIINENNADFHAIAQPFLAEISKVMDNIEKKKIVDTEDYQCVINGIMQLKANGAMFGFPLVSSIAGTALHFMESVASAHMDIVDILKAHHKVIHLIIEHNIRSTDASKQGHALVHELEKACDRYTQKHG